MAWHRRNLLPLWALAFMLGIALARQAAGADLALWALAGALVGLALGFWALIRLSPDRALLVCLPLLCCAGFVHGHAALARPDGPGRLGGLLAERERITVAGRILDMVEHDGNLSRCTLEVFWVLPLPEDGVITPSDPTRHIPEIRKTQKIQKIAGRAALRARGRLPEAARPGARVLALGHAERPQDPARGVDAVLWLKSPEALHILEARPPSALERLRFGPERLRERAARFLQERLPPDCAGVYQALLIGSRQGLAPETLEWFRACGCLHMLAISGLHVGLLAAASGWLLYRLLSRSTRILLSGRARLWALVLTAPLLALYAALAGLNAPVLRALVMALLALAALALCRRRTGLQLVAGAALVLLALRPLALCTASFQLSFAAVTAIALILPRLPWFTPERGGRPRAALLSLVMVSVAATLGTLPFTLWHFNRVSLIGPLMNPLVEPLLCLWALPLGLAALALAWIAPPAAVALLHLGGLGIRAALWLMAKAAALPLASVWTITPHPIEIFLYFLMMALALRGGARARLAACLLACALALSFGLPPRLPRDEARISFIDVGQGASVLVEVPGGRFLIDCGGFFQRDYEVGSRKVAPFLWRRRIRRLDAVLVSHADSDHYSGMPFVLERFAPGRLYVNDSDRDEAPYRALLARAGELGVAARRVTGREELAAGADFALDCFGVAPEDAANLGENDRSLLTRLRFGRRVFLFPGDIAEARERLLLRDGLPDAATNDMGATSAKEIKKIKKIKKMRADVLMAGHHGSIGSTTPDFLAAVQPRAIVVSAAASRRATHPAPEHLARWRDAGIAVFSTAESGAIEARTDGETLCLRAGKPGHKRERCWE